MLSRMWLINTVLACFIVFFGIKAYGIWSEEAKIDPGIQVIESAKEPSKKKRLTRTQIPAKSTYDMIVEKNLFSPDREGSDSVEPEEETNVGRLQYNGETVLLYGVVVADDYKKALIIYPNKPRAGIEKTQWVMEGDRFGNLLVASIKDESVILKADNREWEVKLYDQKKPKIRSPLGSRAAPEEKGIEKKGNLAETRRQLRARALEKAERSQRRPDINENPFEMIVRGLREEQ